MARPRNPERDKAFEIWLASGATAKLKDIANELGVPDSRIRKWKAEDDWDAKIKERSDTNKGALVNSKGSAPKKGAPLGNHNALGYGAPRGNKNAVGNRGGNGGPPGNKKAVTTGEYETIWFDTLTEDEQDICSNINTDTLAQVNDLIKLYSIRERRMMERIKKRMDGLSEKGRRVLKELQVSKNPVQLYDDRTGETKTIIIPEAKLVETEITETEYRSIDDILSIEESLTRVQEKKAKALVLKHDIEIENIDLTTKKQLLEIERMQAEIAKLKGIKGSETNKVQIIDDISGDEHGTG
jgi:uncharacterized protein YjcR